VKLRQKRWSSWGAFGKHGYEQKLDASI
jgi:hypothetical protein